MNVQTIRKRPTAGIYLQSKTWISTIFNESSSPAEAQGHMSSLLWDDAELTVL